MARGEDSRHDPARKVNKERYFRVYTIERGQDSQGGVWSRDEGLHYSVKPELIPSDWGTMSPDQQWQHLSDSDQYPHKTYPGGKDFPIEDEHPDFDTRYEEAFDGNQNTWAHEVIEDTDPDED